MFSEAVYTRLARHFVARLARDRAIEAIERAITLGVLERREQPCGASLLLQGSRIVGWALDRVKLLLRSFAHQRQGADSPECSAVPHGWSDPPRICEPCLEDLPYGGGDGEPVDVNLPAEPGTGKRKTKRSVAAAAAGSSAGEAAAVPVATADVVAEEQAMVPEKRARGSGKGRARARRKRPQPRLDRMALLRLVRRHATPPAATQVVTLLLLADAVARSGHDIADLLAIVRRPKPIIAITGTVAGFEAAFLDLLRCGLVLPGSSRFISTHDLYEVGEHRLSATAARTLILFQGNEAPRDAELVARKVDLAVQNALPILAVADDAERLPTALTDTADVNLVCRPVTPDLIGEVMKVVLGGSLCRMAGVFREWALPAASAEPLVPAGDDPSALLDGCELLTIADLGLAIRPGMSPERSITLLRRLIERARKARSGEVEAVSAEADRAQHARRGRGNSGSTIIEPEPINQASNASPARLPLMVETLTGYGAARDWALALKADLELWREDCLEWSAMSTNVLLAGPPGTGKTTFAKALANSLQLKLFATSVGTWLEPGNLGEVLRRMSAAFNEAGANAPCILFIDEIDGIGRRGGTNSQRPYDDYWVSVVNRALELLDGVVKSEGVIVLGATNNPEAIDQALLRSGRLERRIDISLPDIDALVGILRHHLAQDLEAVVESATTGQGRHSEAAETQPTDPKPPKTDGSEPSAGALLSEQGRSQPLLPNSTTTAAEVPRSGLLPGNGDGPVGPASIPPRRSIGGSWITTLIRKLTGGSATC